MRALTVRNVNEAYHLMISDAMSLSRDLRWRKIASRNGVVLEYREPVTTTFIKPRERVLFDRIRDCNPFFHVMEFMWMLSGSESVEWLAHFNSNIEKYSDNGKTFHGAYGYRWRSLWFDQIDEIIHHLNMFPESRRAVLQMWDASQDLGVRSKDLPCNTHAYFKIRDNDLQMMVCNRSNDIIWGAYGANVVHFSFLQEYIAGRLELGIGRYTHVSDSFHIYLDNPAYQRHTVNGLDNANHYTFKATQPLPLILNAQDFDYELMKFMGDKWAGWEYEEPFFRDVAVPMRLAWDCYKKGLYDDSMVHARKIASLDWKIVCVGWLQRRRRNDELKS